MHDMLFSNAWAEIDVTHFIGQLKESFGQVDLKTFPNYLLMQRLQTVAMLIILLENDPLKSDGLHKGINLTTKTLNEIRRQASILTAEYRARVADGSMIPDSQPQTFLAQFTEVKSTPKPVVIGTRSVELGASINRQ